MEETPHRGVSWSCEDTTKTNIATNFELWIVDPMLLQLCVDGLSEARLLKTDYLRFLDSEEFFQILCRVMLDHWIMPEIFQDFRPAVFRKVTCDEHEVQLALASPQGVSANDQNPRSRDERKQ